MKRSLIIIGIVLVSILLFSCGSEELEQTSDFITPDTNPMEKLIKAHDIMKKRVSGIISNSLSADENDIYRLLYSLHTQSELITEIDRLEILGREMIKPSFPLRITVDTLKDKENTSSQTTTTINYGKESLAFIDYNIENETSLLIPTLTDTVLVNKKKISFDAIKKDLLILLMTEDIDEKYLTESTSNYRNGDIEYYSANVITFNTSVYHDIIKCITTYFYDGSPFSICYTLSIGNDEITVEFLFPTRNDGTDTFSISVNRVTDKAKVSDNILHLSFYQKKEKSKEISGHFFLSANTDAIREYGFDAPDGLSYFSFESLFDTEFSETRSSTMATCRLEYEMYGIKKFHNLPLRILTDVKNGTLNSKASIVYSDDEFTSFNCSTIMNVSVSQPHTVNIYQPDKNKITFDYNDTEEKEKYMAEVEMAFFEKFPEIAFLLPYEAQSPKGPEKSVIAAFSPDTSKKYVIYHNGTNECNGMEITGVSYIYHNGKFEISSKDGSVIMSITSDKLGSNFLPDTDFIFTTEDGAIISLNKSGSGTISKEIILRLKAPEGNGTSSIDLLYKNGCPIFSDAVVNYNGGKATVTQGDKQYTFSYSLQ
ncbi:MAG: hypothetical protein IKT70_01920 [Clostridia bacterium]|nr:hypothetical protein [Clostridia bacterium]